MAGRQHHVEVASPGVVCIQPFVERAAVAVAGRLRPHLFGHDAWCADAGGCLLDGRRIKRERGMVRGHVSAANETCEDVDGDG